MSVEGQKPQFEPYERTGDNALESLKSDRRAVLMVRSFMDRSRRYREPHLDLAARAREMYENWRSAGRSMVMRANLKLPFGFTIIETQLPQLVDIFLRNERYLKFEGRTQDDFDWEELLTDFHQRQFDEMAFPTKFIQFCKGMLLDGTAVAKVPYRYQEVRVKRKVTEFDPIFGETEVEQEVAEPIFDQPDFQPISLVDFFPDWSVKSPGDIANMRGCVHRTYKTFNELKQLERRGGSGIYKNLDEVKMSMKQRSSAMADPHFMDEKNKLRSERMQDNRRGIKDGDKIEIWEYWGLWDPKGDGKFQQYIITLAHGDVVIRADRNFYNYKFKPFVASVNYPRDGEFYGIPELLAVRSLIKEANQLRNARLDNVNLSVNPMWLVDRAAGVPVKSLFSRPNGIVLTDDMNGIKPLQVQDPSIGSLRESQDIQQDIQTASASIGSAPQLSQLGKTFGRSATGVEFINNIASSRIGLKARLLSNLVFRPMGWMMFMTNRQFVSDDQWVRSTDPNEPNPFKLLPPDAFFRQYDFKIQTDIETGGPEAEFQKLNMFTQLASVAEQSQPGTVDFEVVFESLGRKLFGPRVKKFTRSDKERLQLQQQKLAAEQATNAETGAGAPQPGPESSGGFNGGGNFF